MPILRLKKDEAAEPSGGEEVVLSSMDRRIERRLVTPQRIAVVAGAVALLA
jgi:hypothetical protein